MISDLCIDNKFYKTSIYVNQTKFGLYNDLSNMSYDYDEIDIKILKQFAQNDYGLKISDIIRSYPDAYSRIVRLIDNNLIVPSSIDETQLFKPHRIDIETVRQCNARCKYCPQSISPKSYGVMPLDLFNKIIEKLNNIHPEWIALNHYGETLLDPFFKQRLTILRKKGFLLRLITNGTLLTDSLIDFIKEGGLYGVVFNFPSLDTKEWCEFTQLSPHIYLKTRKALEKFITLSPVLPDGIVIAVNALNENQKDRARELNNYFSSFGNVRVYCEVSHSRAGSVLNSYTKKTNNNVGLYYAGCRRFVGHLHISWEGKIFQCCQDYEQKVILGNLLTQDIESIMISPPVKQLRGEIFGLYPIIADRLCIKCPLLRRSRLPVNNSVILDL